MRPSVEAYVLWDPVKESSTRTAHRQDSVVEYHHRTWKVFPEEQVHYQGSNRTASAALAPNQGDLRLESRHRRHPVRRNVKVPDFLQDLKRLPVTPQDFHHVA